MRSTQTRKAEIRDNPVRALAKAVHLLEQLAEEREATPRRLSELLEEPRTTVYRLLGSLEELDLVEQGSQPGTYRLGWKLMRLGAAVVERLDERQLALPVMERIHERVGETVFLLVRRGWDAVCIERLEGLRVQSLAWEPREEWEAFAGSGHLASLTDRTPTTRDDLFRELEDTLAKGYAISDEDVTPGIASIGAPIFDYTGGVRAALSIGGLKTLVLGADRDLIVELVVDGAREISAALGQHEANDGSSPAAA
jgi:DNA-binding IclR family transcriptional regulator